VVIIKEKIIKAVCKDKGAGGVTLTTPFNSTAAAILSVDTDRYCGEWGGTEIKNDVKLVKRKDATAPATCPVPPTPTPTHTNTNTPANTATSTATPSATSTSTITPTPANTATSTVTNTATPSPTNTPVVCPLAPGAYTLTQVSGGVLTVDGLPAFPFPAGGTIVQDVGPGDPSCVHSTVVPFPGGFSAPAFCIPALGFTTSVVQTGCGIGLIDSNGGSDFTITEIGDTSAPGAPCFLTPSCSSGANSNVRVDITIGDGAADTCAPPGTANATVSVPVFTTTWLKIGMCPDGDGMFSGGDILVVSFPQTLDFTTDSTLGDWADLDPDGCCIAGAGPASFTNPCTPGGAGGLAATGTCLHVAGIGAPGVDTTTVAAGAIGSSGSPLYDLTFVTVLPNTATGPGAPLGAVCPSPPILTYGGTATRCIP
jgi:hypothetical protein